MNEQKSLCECAHPARSVQAIADDVLAEALREIVVMPMKGASFAHIIARAEAALRDWRKAMDE